MFLMKPIISFDKSQQIYQWKVFEKNDMHTENIFGHMSYYIVTLNDIPQKRYRDLIERQYGPSYFSGPIKTKVL